MSIKSYTSVLTGTKFYKVVDDFGRVYFESTNRDECLSFLIDYRSL